MSAWADIKARKQPRTTTVPLALDDDDTLDQLDAARSALRVAERAARANVADGAAQERLAEAQERVEAAVEAAREHVVEFTVRSIGRAAFNLILNEHPIEEGEETGPKADEQAAQVLAACLVEPAMSIEEAREFVSGPEWSTGEVHQVVAACHMVNTQVRRVNLGNA